MLLSGRLLDLPSNIIDVLFALFVNYDRKKLCNIKTMICLLEYIAGRFLPQFLQNFFRL